MFINIVVIRIFFFMCFFFIRCFVWFLIVGVVFNMGVFRYFVVDFL